jgi:hypothetical protein
MRISFKSTKLQSLQRWAKIVVVNLVIFLFLFIVAEILARSVWTVQSCMKSECDFSRFAGLKVRKIPRSINIGFTRFDELLGYVLVVGDSFTFGEQVSDNETWPACLERKLGRGVDNGGVGGYGTAQALRRASLKLAEKSYNTLVLSTLVETDDWNFGRDRLSYRNGFPKPTVIYTKNGIGWSAVPDPNAPG